MSEENSPRFPSQPTEGDACSVRDVCSRCLSDNDIAVAEPVADDADHVRVYRRDGVCLLYLVRTEPVRLAGSAPHPERAGCWRITGGILTGRLPAEAPTRHFRSPADALSYLATHTGVGYTA